MSHLDEKSRSRRGNNPVCGCREEWQRGIRGTRSVDSVSGSISVSVGCCVVEWV